MSSCSSLSLNAVKNSKSHIQHPSTGSDVGLRREILVFDYPLGIGKSITPVVPVVTNDHPCEEFVRTNCAQYGCGKTIDEIEKCSVSNITTLDLSAKNWKCSKCRYSTNKKRNLNKHNISMHTLEKKWKCAKCNFSTKRESNLDKHDMNRHSLEKKWKCSKCDFSSNDKQSFNIHNITIHALEKKWKCVKCDYSTNRNSNLVEHNMIIHFPEKKWKCSECNYFTHYRNNIDRHISSHSQKNWDVDIRKHVHVVEDKYMCSLCDYTGEKMYLLNAHIKRMHL